MTTEDKPLLEDLDALRRRDPSGMLGSISAFPDQLDGLAPAELIADAST